MTIGLVLHATIESHVLLRFVGGKLGHTSTNVRGSHVRRHCTCTCTEPRIITSCACIKLPFDAMSVKRKRSEEHKGQNVAGLADARRTTITETHDYLTPECFALERKASDPRFDRRFNSGRLIFPNLLPARKARMTNGVLKLNSECERKYRSWSDPTVTFEQDSWWRGEIFYHDLHSTCTTLPPLGRQYRDRTRAFDEKSFCDSLSSFPCSTLSSTRDSPPCTILEDREIAMISKYHRVLEWIHD